MTVRTPCVERKQGSQYTEAQEDEREEKSLHFGRDVALGDFKDLHGIATGSVEDAENTNQQEGRATHEHQCQFHGCIFLLTASPHTDEQIHRYQGYFIEHEHGEQVGRDKETIYTGAQQSEPQEIFLGHRLQLPGGKSTGEYDDGAEQQHGHRNTVYAYGVADVQWLVP